MAGRAPKHENHVLGTALLPQLSPLTSEAAFWVSKPKSNWQWQSIPGAACCKNSTCSLIFWEQLLHFNQIGEGKVCEIVVWNERLDNAFIKLKLNLDGIGNMVVFKGDILQNDQVCVHHVHFSMDATRFPKKLFQPWYRITIFTFTCFPISVIQVHKSKVYASDYRCCSWDNSISHPGNTCSGMAMNCCAFHGTAAQDGILCWRGEITTGQNL